MKDELLIGKQIEMQTEPEVSRLELGTFLGVVPSMEHRVQESLLTRHPTVEALARGKTHPVAMFRTV